MATWQMLASRLALNASAAETEKENTDNVLSLVSLRNPAQSWN